MSIKEVEVIPATPKNGRQAYREMIRDDIKEAIDKRITKFELIGDYNYKYLNQYAREEGERYFTRYLWSPVRKRVCEELQKKYNEKYWFWGPNNYDEARKFIRVHRVKMEDRIHVYVTLDYDYLDNLYEYFKEAAEKDYEKSKKRKEERLKKNE